MGVSVGVGHGAREPQGEPAVRAGPSLSSLGLTIGHPCRRMPPMKSRRSYVRLAIRLLKGFRLLGQMSTEQAECCTT
jgi:hypothetical protein